MEMELQNRLLSYSYKYYKIKLNNEACQDRQRNEKMATGL